MYVDSHCHFDMFENPLQIIKECERQKIVTIGMTNLPSHFEMGFPHIKNFKYIRMALGLHPLLAQKHHDELLKFKKHVEKTSYIGEVGLDFSKEGIDTKDIQIKSFEFVLDTIKNKKKIISLHSRRAEKEVLDSLIKYKIDNAIFHWYSGSVIVLRQIIEKGYYFSINTSMINSTQGKKIIAQIPLDKVLTETDSPYVQYKGKPARPENVSVVINYLALLYKKSPLEMENQVYRNFNDLIKNIR